MADAHAVQLVKYFENTVHKTTSHNQPFIRELICLILKRFKGLDLQLTPFLLQVRLPHCIICIITKLTFPEPSIGLSKHWTQRQAPVLTPEVPANSGALGAGEVKQRGRANDSN